MKPAPLDYARPDSLSEAIKLLSTTSNAKIIAGGQSLVPLLNFRLSEPALLVDITGIPDMGRIDETKSGGVSVGALVTQRALETSLLLKARFPIVHEAVKHVAHLAIRNRGTIGGSLSHADPAAELVLLALLLDAKLRVAGPSQLREIEAEEFFLSPLTTALKDNEVLTSVEFPPLPKRTGFAFDEHSIREGDFALCAVGVTLSLGDGILSRITGASRKIAEARIALIGAADIPVRMRSAEQLLQGSESLDDELVERVAVTVRDAADPSSDLHASAEYRKHLAYAMTKRSLRAAWKKLSTDIETGDRH